MTTVRRTLKIGAVSYLNTKPLVFGLAETIAPYAELSFAVPSRLAIQLAAGELDVGLIPAIEYFRNPSYRIVSNACIACEGPVWSVQVLFRKPPAEARTLALDEGSRTSAALTQILLLEKFGVVPQTVELPLSAALADCQADAMLVIGDRAMHLNELPQQFVQRWDLGQVWLEHTGLPFVFAMWVAGPSGQAHPACETLTRALETQRDIGLQHAAEIAQQCGPNYRLTEAQVIAYLTRFLHYKIEQPQRAALELYRSKAVDAGLITEPEVVDCNMKVPC